jgi:predicted choloylglycine hydrolase
MTNSEITQFLNAFEDFTQHFTEIDENHIKVYVETAESFWSDIELLAATYEVPCDYIIEEFIID